MASPSARTQASGLAVQSTAGSGGSHFEAEKAAPAASPAAPASPASPVSGASSASQVPLSASGRPMTHHSNVTRQQLCDKFHDFDTKAVYDNVIQAGLHENALNFVVHFGTDKARVACDLDSDDICQLMQTRNLFDSSDMPVRWINIWNPSRQRATIETIGRTYGFSARLVLSIWAWDHVKKTLQGADTVKVSRLVGPKRRHLSRSKAASPPAPPPPVTGKSADCKVPVLNDASGDDLERGMKILYADDNADAHTATDVPLVSDPFDDTLDLEDILTEENMATFHMMQNTIDYTSIDQENEFICIGANWLHRRPKFISKKPPPLVPPKHWSWFALCHDNTVLSFHEAAYYDKIPNGADKAKWKNEELQNMRSNTLKVLRQLSICGLKEDRHKIMQLTSVRRPLITSQHGRTISRSERGAEGSSSLFFYLFEDYSAAVDILNYSSYSLQTISNQILGPNDWLYKSDELEIIPTLYKLNKELRQLHHLFSNYKTLISRILNSGQNRMGGNNIDGVRDGRHGSASIERERSSFELGAEQPETVIIANRARSRFKRLQVQLQSLMLDRIKDYLDEKDSLQETYFNLTNQKDSQATERLTRSATLLAKLSVFFLPISFMTSFFSVAIPEFLDSYSKKTYWAAFAVVATLSFMSLFFFSKVIVFVSERLGDASDRLARGIAHLVSGDEKKGKREDEDE